ncbi:MAG: DUF1800 domain-containing protein [Acidobacteriota bacterium]
MRGNPQLEHVVRRMGFGATAQELSYFDDAPIQSVVNILLDYERVIDDPDAHIGDSAYVGVTTRGQFSPNTVINDARQRELFRMIHSLRPLQEKMALFWHNHFATAYSKVAGTVGGEHGTRLMAGKPSESPGGQRGQYQLFRDMATGNFRDLLAEVARDPAMVIWLDSRLNTRTRPQENFGREIMELFTMGVGNYTEADVVAAARVFTGFNIRVVGDRRSAATSYYEFIFNEGNHDTNAKEFTFPIYPDGGRTIPARPASQGLQDAADFINALARHPATANRLARKLFNYFVSELYEPDPEWISQLATVYLQNNFSIKAMLRHLFAQPYFLDPAAAFSRYAWPIEYVVRAIKETGYTGLSVDAAMTPLVNMGQQLFEPPDVNGWALGAEWFSTASMLARMNFAATLMSNQKFNLGREAQPYRQSPERILDYMLNRFEFAPMSGDVYQALRDYARGGSAWTGADAQVNNKAAGIARLIVASGEYQFN